MKVMTTIYTWKGFDYNENGEHGDLGEHEEDGHHDQYQHNEARTPDSPALLATSALNAKTTNHLFPAQESAFQKDTTLDDANLQQYITSYNRIEHTKEVDFLKIRSPYFQRRLHQSMGSFGNTDAAFFRTFANDDNQTVPISADTYKTYWEGGFTFYREASGSEKKQDNDHFGLSGFQRRTSPLEELSQRQYWPLLLQGGKSAITIINSLRIRSLRGF
jgi:hypothetical protein